MIVGTTVLNYNELRVYAKRPNELVTYVDNLVPVWARHISPIVYNQRYYVAIHVRNMLSLPYKVRMEAANILTKGISVKGIISGFTSITDILDSCNKEDMLKVLRGEQNGKKS